MTQQKKGQKGQTVRGGKDGRDGRYGRGELRQYARWWMLLWMLWLPLRLLHQLRFASYLACSRCSTQSHSSSALPSLALLCFNYLQHAKLSPSTHIYTPTHTLTHTHTLAHCHAGRQGISFMHVKGACNALCMAKISYTVVASFSCTWVCVCTCVSVCAAACVRAACCRFRNAAKYAAKFNSCVLAACSTDYACCFCRETHMHKHTNAYTKHTHIHPPQTGIQLVLMLLGSAQF